MGFHANMWQVCALKAQNAMPRASLGLDGQLWRKVPSLWQSMQVGCPTVAMLCGWSFRSSTTPCNCFTTAATRVTLLEIATQKEVEKVLSICFSVGMFFLSVLCLWVGLFSGVSLSFCCKHEAEAGLSQIQLNVSMDSGHCVFLTGLECVR